MSRPHKFRAWHIGEAKMYTNIAVLVCPDELFRIYDSYGQKEYIGNDKHCEIMQYTGLLDKNGVEIYEGDIVQSGECGLPFVVQWEDIHGDHPDEDFVLGVGFTLFDPHGKPNVDVVIGNIYENPELVGTA